MAAIVKKPGSGSTGKRYLNTHFGKPIFGPSRGTAPTARMGANPRAGMSYSVGLDRNGRVVHIYRDGERIVMHTHAPNAAPPHPDSFGGMAAPDTQAAANSGNFGADASALAQQLAGAHRAHPDNALTQQHALALQAALAAYKSQFGA
ncbi:MAG: hypothetical protein ACXVGB_00615 [Mycobacteriaceae bacterium]